MSRYKRTPTILGKGAFKICYKALDLEEGLEVAWNIFQTNKHEFLQIQNEIDILKTIKHPNIISLIDFWIDDSQLIFITELMTSGTLKHFISQKGIVPNFKMIKKWSIQILNYSAPIPFPLNFIQITFSFILSFKII